MSDSFRKVLWVNDGNPTWPGHNTHELELADIAHSDRVECYTSKTLQAEITQLREAVRVLAHDKVNGVPDMIGADVVSNRIAYDAVNKALSNPTAAAVRGEVKHGPG